MAYCITNRWALICSPQRSISWCNMLTLQMETSFTTIPVCLWQEFHSRTCTELSLWWWTPYYTPQWSKKHQSPSNEWCLSQCWIGTNPATHHQREATPCTALPTQKMGDVLTSRHRGSRKMIDNVHFLMLGCAHTYHSLPPSTCYRRH